MTSITSTCHACGATYRGRVDVCPNCKAAIEHSSAFRPGDIIDGKYEVVALLGVGGMGHVFKVRHLHLDAFRTIKKLRKDLLADESYRSRFAREARLATRVQHRNVALVHDFATLPDGASYIVSEFIEGVTLRQWMQAHGRFSLELALQIAKQALSGIEMIHRAGLVHRDISPDNIMITTGADGLPLAKIIDLGIAKASDAPIGDATQAGMYVGNPRYSSPEQLGALRVGEVIDARVDIYCFGGVLYEMLSGAAPFASNSPQGYAIQHLTQRPPSLRTYEPAIPEGLDAAVLKALEKNREHRHASAKEMAAALAPFASGVLTQTSQMKLETLREGVGSDRTPPPRHAAIPATLTPVPEASDDGKLMDELDLLIRRGDVSGLSRLADLHPPGSAIGTAVRAALDRMADETLRNASKEEEIEDAALVAVLIEDGTLSEQEVMERHRDARAAFHAAIEALRAGNPRPAEALVAQSPALHIRQRLNTGLADHYGEIAWTRVRHGSAEEVREFLKQYPTHRFTSAAKGRLRDLEETAAAGGSERQAFDAAITAGTEAAWLRFLETHPNGARVREATAMLAETRDYQRAMNSGTQLAFQIYIATWPRGRHHAEVAAALSNLLKGNPAPPRPPAAGARALPLTRVELIPGTVAEPLTAGTDPAPIAGEHARNALWLYAIAAVTAAAVLIAAVLWWTAS